MNTDSVSIFVRNAWRLLAIQLVAAAAAVAVTVWAALQVRPLLEEREQLSRQNEQLSKSIVEAKARVDNLIAEERSLKQRVAALRAELQGARDATPVLTQAINAFHQKEYDRAVVKYDEALKLNPGDAYIHNLKSYSQFKAGDFSGAVETMSRALQINPAYEWGYFDLARYQCAAGAPDAGLRTITGALEARGDSIRSAIQFFLTKDGEFRRLCAPIAGTLRKLAEEPARGPR